MKRLTYYLGVVLACSLWMAVGPQRPGAVPASAQSSATKRTAASRRATPLKKAASFDGNHEAVNCNYVAGWAWDRSRPNTPIKVAIYDGTKLLGTVIANVSRRDLLNAKKGNGKHGFLYRTPFALKDGKRHSIRVRVAGTNINLPNTPRTLVCPDAKR